MRHIDDDERRARIAQRHGIAPGRRHTDAKAATEAMTVLHATENATVYLSLAARVDGLTPADVDAVLYDERSLVKQLAMRRTLFVFPRELLPAGLGSAAARVAQQERARLVRDAVASGIAADGEAWLAEATDAVLAHLAGREAVTTRQLRAAVPAVAGTIMLGEGRWGGEVPIAPRLLTYLSTSGLVARGPNGGHWRLSRPQWTLMTDWLAGEPDPLPPDAGYAEVVRRWLWTFGPGTEADLAWWLGAPLGTVRGALRANDAVAVTLDSGTTGWVLPDDLDPVADDEPWAALLPVLDPTTMGWKERGFYLGPHGRQVFDTAGNAGTTAWWNGRIVGCWLQDDSGRIRIVFLEEVPTDARVALGVEAERLSAWLGDVRLASVYTAPAVRAARPGAALAQRD